MARKEDGRALHIIDMAVLAATRGRGIGTQVISCLECAAREMRATKLMLSVALTNMRARRLYERLEFIATEEIEANIAMVKYLT